MKLVVAALPIRKQAPDNLLFCTHKNKNIAIIKYFLKVYTWALSIHEIKNTCCSACVENSQSAPGYLQKYSSEYSLQVSLNSSLFSTLSEEIFFPWLPVHANLQILTRCIALQWPHFLCSLAVQQSQAAPHSEWMLFVQSSVLRGDLRLPLFYSLIVLLLYPQHCLNERFTVTGLPHQLARC